jgi:uncharacterized delta-60 repeat protein
MMSRKQRFVLSMIAASGVVSMSAATVLAADGDLDPTFDSDGIVTTPLLPAGNSYGRDIAVQSDGKIVLVGKHVSGSEDYVVIRYGTDGTLDPTFGTGGIVTTDVDVKDQGFGVTVQSDGKILLVGASNDGGGVESSLDDFVVIRYDTNGSLDASFGTNGIVRFDYGRNLKDLFTDVEVQGDGKIVAFGKVEESTNVFDMVVARFETNGSLDTSFDTNGLVTLDLGGSDAGGRGAIQSDGKYLIAGSSDANGSSDFAVARFEATGSLDSSFGTNGVVVTDLGSSSNDYSGTLVVQPDGKIVAAGVSNAEGSNDVALVRYLADGSVDASFGSGGTVLSDIGTNSSDVVQSVLLRSDGMIVVSGYTGAPGQNEFLAARFTADGSPDTSFGSNGIVTTDLGGDDFSFASALQADGKIVLGGYALVDGAVVMAVVRYGVPDPTPSSTSLPAEETTTTVGTDATTTTLAGASPITSVTGELPATGGGASTSTLALLALAGGVVLSVAARRRVPSR